MQLFYNTNGFAHHRLEDAVDILADYGYDGISLTPDVHHLDPYHTTPSEVDRFGAHMARCGLALTIEAGARFVIDPQRKHHPNLLSSSGFERRQDFYRRLIDLSAALGSPLVSIWSGACEDPSPRADTMRDLAERLKPVLDYAAERGVWIAFEPEPGMFIETAAHYRQLTERLPDHDLRLTLDTGHLAAVERPPYEEIIRQSADTLINLQADDSPLGKHEHSMFGDGAIDFPPLFAALREIDYQGPVSVELSRHSHIAPQAALLARDYLRRFMSPADHPKSGEN